MRWGAAGVMLMALAACGDPAWRNPATAHGSAAVAPEVMAAAASEIGRLNPTAPARRTSRDPLPAPPEWAAPLMGKPLRLLFPTVANCLGNVDAVRTRYVGPAAGAAVVGWAWDPLHKAPPPRILLVDDDFLIQGAGVSGESRPGVPRARPEVTSDAVGWQAVTWRVAGPVYAWGLQSDGKTICKLGQLEL